MTARAEALITATGASDKQLEMQILGIFRKYDKDNSEISTRRSSLSLFVICLIPTRLRRSRSS